MTARIKMPSGQGLWPAFWLVGSDENTNPWPPNVLGVTIGTPAMAYPVLGAQGQRGEGC